MTRRRSLYRMFKRADGAAPVAMIVVAMIALACALTTVGVIRVSRQHEVLQLGYQLSRGSDQVHKLREARRRLELERATLTAPDRIRRLAGQLGMTPVAPDRIRIIEVHQPVAHPGERQARTRDPIARPEERSARTREPPIARPEERSATTREPPVRQP